MTKPATVISKPLDALQIVECSAKPLNILLVEDDDGDAKAVQRAFHKTRIANPLIRAIDGMDALDILRGSNGKAKLLPPYLLLVDLNMPRMNGIQLIHALRGDQQLRHTLAFILSTSKRDEDKTAAYDLNVAGYIVKATAGSDFLNLSNLIECYRRIVEMP
jgi:CheY-like chemotaxis protein